MEAAWFESLPLITLVAAAGAVALVPISHDGCSFEPERWRAAMTDSRGQVERYRQSHPLAERIVDCEEIIGGEDRAGVRALLGPPSQEWRSA